MQVYDVYIKSHLNIYSIFVLQIGGCQSFSDITSHMIKMLSLGKSVCVCVYKTYAKFLLHITLAVGCMALSTVLSMG